MAGGLNDPIPLITIAWRPEFGVGETSRKGVFQNEKSPFADSPGAKNAASNSVRIHEIRVQLRPKSRILGVNFGEESQ